MSRLPLFLSAPYACGYLPNREARTAFVDPRRPLTTDLYTRLANLGFRRSGPFVYRPACAGCQACESTRIAVQNFSPSRAQRRCLERNHDLQVEEHEPGFTDERYKLYQRYLRARHPDGEMDPNDRDGFARFLGESWCAGSHVEFRLDGKLFAVLVIDRLDDGLSAVYSFFDPDGAARSPGRYMILWMITAARERSLPFAYLGYWIDGCKKMSYKGEYQPLELFTGGLWRPWPKP